MHAKTWVVWWLSFGGLAVFVFGLWMAVKGSEDQSVAQVQMSFLSSRTLTDYFTGSQPPINQTAEMLDARDLEHLGQVLSVIGPGAMVVGAGGAILGIVLGSRGPSAKSATMEPVTVQSLPIQTEPGASDRQPCPYCGESISVLARICRFCQHDLNPASGGTPGGT